MDFKTGFTSQNDVAELLGKASRPATAWAFFNSRVDVTGATQRRLRTIRTVVDQERKETLIAMLSTQLRWTMPQSIDDPRRTYAAPIVDVCRNYASTLDSIIPRVAQNTKQFVYEEETWQLLAALLNCGTFLREGVLSWIQRVSKKSVEEAIQDDADEERGERFWTILGWLVAANLNLDAARLAIAEGEMDLGQLLMWRHRPEILSKLIQDYKQDRRHQSSTMHPKLAMILDLLCGESESLLNDLRVDWRIRLGIVLSREDEDASSMYHVLEQFYARFSTRITIDDMQFKLILLFAKLREGIPIRAEHVSQILQLDMSSTPSPDACLKWQMYTVLTASDIVHSENLYGDAVAQLCHSMYDLCEAFEIPQWGVFVCLHPVVPWTFMETQIKRILNANVMSWMSSIETESFLRDGLKIPSIWLLEAKAFWHKNRGDLESQFGCWIAAENFNEAHGLLLRRIFPNLIANGGRDWQTMIRFLSEHQLIQHRDTIENWELGGDILITIGQALAYMSPSINEMLSEFLKVTANIEQRLFEAKLHWRRFSTSEEEKRKIEQMFNHLSYQIERHYCHLYAQANGEQYILTRILMEKCRNRERQMQLWNEANYQSS